MLRDLDDALNWFCVLSLILLLYQYFQFPSISHCPLEECECEWKYICFQSLKKCTPTPIVCNILLTMCSEKGQPHSSGATIPLDDIGLL